MLNLHYENNSYICNTIYDLKDFPKDAGFNWNKDRKAWVTTSFVSVLNLLEDLKSHELEHSTTSDFDFQFDISDKELKERIAAASKTSSDFVVPSPFGLEYLPYQKAGIEFAVAKGNALIADEMGLGKTIQAIGVVNFKNAKKILVVCPATLKSNWKRELQKWLVNPELAKSVSVLTSK